MTEFAGWDNFYVIIGGSAGALIGLQFVVMTLIAEVPRARMAPQAAHAFSTPTIIYFGTVLLLSGLCTAPWRSAMSAATAWGVIGLIGLVRTISVSKRLTAQTFYRLVFEDWLCHVILPVAAFTLLLISAVASRVYLHESLFGVAAAALLLLFTAIHNAWDAVTYHLFHFRPSQEQSDEAPQS